MFTHIQSLNKDFAEICGFKTREIKRKIIISKIWNDLDKFKNDIGGLTKYFKRYRTDVYATVSLCPYENIPVSGFYCPESNRIELIVGSFAYDIWDFTDEKWSEFKFIVIQTFCHELIHMMQFANRDFNWSERKCKYRKIKSKAINEDREYHASLDEIQAYAHCIYLEMMEFGMGIPDEKSKSHFYNCSVTFQAILKVFGRRMDEPVIQKTIYHINRWHKRYSKK